MSTLKSAPLLLADDIDLDPEQERRSNAVKTCARALAQKLGTSIALVHVEDLSLYPVRVPQYKPLIDRYYKDRKSRLAETADSLNVRCKPIFVSGNPVQELLALSSKRNAYELIVLGTHGRTGVGRLFMGSVAEEVIRQAPIPIMTVGPKAQENADEFLTGPALKLLIPTGLTPNSARAEDYGVALAARLGAEVVFIHSMHEALHPVLQTAFSAPSPPAALHSYFEEIKAESIKQLSLRAKKAFKKGVKASYALDDRTLQSSAAVVKEAKRIGASLIVMGTHGRSMISGAFFGRTARGVLLESPVPVITVRSKKV